MRMSTMPLQQAYGQLSFSGPLSTADRYNITPLDPITPYNGEGLWFVIVTSLIVLVLWIISVSLGKPQPSKEMVLLQRVKHLIDGHRDRNNKYLALFRIRQKKTEHVQAHAADLFTEGRKLMEKAILMYLDENPQGLTNATISTALNADPPGETQKGWITHKYLNAMCATDIVERVYVFDTSPEPLPPSRFSQARSNFTKCLAEVPVDKHASEWGRFHSSPIVQKRYLKPRSILYRTLKKTI